MPVVTIRDTARRTGHEFISEDPIEDGDYIIGADVAMGSTFGAVNEALDWSTLSVWKREPFHLIQVAELRTRADNFSFGLMVAAWGQKYNHAMVNVERNLAHGVIAGLRSADYPMDRWFRPQVHASSMDALQGQWFFHKNRATQRILMDTLRDYTTERLLAWSPALLEELASLRRDERGDIDTNGKDLVIACAMAIIVDATEEMPTVIPVKNRPEPPNPSIHDLSHYPEHGKQSGVDGVGFTDDAGGSELWRW